MLPYSTLQLSFMEAKMVEQCTIHAIRVRRPTITDCYATRWAVAVVLATGERREYDRVAVVGGSITFETRPDSESGPHAYAVVGEGAVLVATSGEDVTSFDVAGNVAWFGRSAPPEPGDAVTFDATRMPESRPDASTVCGVEGCNCAGFYPSPRAQSVAALALVHSDEHAEQVRESEAKVCACGIEGCAVDSISSPLAQADGAAGVESA